MKKFRSKPKEIEAVQYDGNIYKLASDLKLEKKHDFLSFYDENGEEALRGSIFVSVAMVRTVQGEWVAFQTGEWIVKEDMPGRFYPIDPDVFKKRYEEVS